MLSRISNYNYLVKPSSYLDNPTFDYWIHMSFSFCAVEAGVVVDGWWITNSVGANIRLTDLTYNQVQFLASTMAQFFTAHEAEFYSQLESVHYEGATSKASND
jgi:hypothetical protein